MKRTMLLVVALLATAVGGAVSPAANAQSGDGSMILARGARPLTRRMVDQMIDFFEFMLDGKFTLAQRAEFQRGRIAEWKAGRQEDIDSSMKVIGLYEELLTLTEDQRNDVKGRVQGELLRAIDRKPNDPLAKLLLTVYRSGRRLDVRNGGAIDDKGVRQAAAFPQEVIGEWQASSGGTTGYVNPNTGSSSTSGNRQHYRFFPDGRFIEAALMTSSLYNCTMQISVYKTGVYSVDGPDITLDEKNYNFTSRDSCRPQWNYEKHPPVSRETYRWRIQQTPDGLKLVMTNAQGASSVFSRVNPGAEILK